MIDFHQFFTDNDDVSLMPISIFVIYSEMQNWRLKWTDRRSHQAIANVQTAIAFLSICLSQAGILLKQLNWSTGHQAISTTW